MEIKKSKEADLERDRMDLVLMGLIIAFSVVYIAFEWTKGKDETVTSEDFTQVIEEGEEEVAPITEQPDLPPPPPPAAPEVPVEIEFKQDEHAVTQKVEIQTENTDKAIEAAPAVNKVVEEVKEEEVDNTIYTHVDKKAKFPGGDQALLTYLGTHIHYPEAARENGSQGTSFIKFTVNIDGSITDVEVVRSAGDPSLDNEAMKVIKSMPKWAPGENNNKKVRSKFQVPVRFKLG